VAPGPPVPPRGTAPVAVERERRLVAEDEVELPRLYLRWPTPPNLSPGDAALDAVAGVLAGGKNARLYRRLVYERQVAQDVSAYQASARLASAFDVVVTARPGHGLEEMRAVVDEELTRLQTEPPTARELERFRNQLEASFLTRLESLGGGGGKADQLNAYFFTAGDPDFFEEDLARYRALSPSDLQAAAGRWLGPGRVALSVVPLGHPELGLPGSEKVH
jgi:zinc protease